MPEGDALHRAARSLQPLVGERVEVVTPHPRARVTRVAERLDGKRLLRVEAVGKNLLLRFEGGLVLRSHLRMTGRWQLLQRGDGARKGTPWLVLRGATSEAVLWNGPVLELDESHVRRLGPDILADPPDLDAMIVKQIRPPQSAKRSSTSASSQASATSGARKRSGAPRSRHGGSSPTSRTRSSARC
jgi:endonuclease VIII